MAVSIPLIVFLAPLIGLGADGGYEKAEGEAR